MSIYEVKYKRTLAFSHQWQQHNYYFYPFSFISVVTNKNIITWLRYYLRVKEWKTNVGDYRLPLSLYFKISISYKSIIDWFYRYAILFEQNPHFGVIAYSESTVVIWTIFIFSSTLVFHSSYISCDHTTLQLMCGLFVLWGDWRPPV